MLAILAGSRQVGLHLLKGLAPRTATRSQIPDEPRIPNDQSAKRAGRNAATHQICLDLLQ